MDFLPDPEEKKKKQLNPMYKLEANIEEPKKESLAPVIEELIQYRMDNWKDDFDKNLMLRRKFREEKEEHRKKEEEEKKIKNFGIPLEDLTKSELDKLKNVQFK